MYKIYTSYFSNKVFKGLNEQENVYRIPVCAILYGNYTFTRWYKELAPDKELLRQYNQIGYKTNAIKYWFSEKYLEKLEKLKKDNVLDTYIKELLELVKYNDVFLLCYEKPKEFCHRHILASYLNEHYDLDISEF